MNLELKFSQNHRVKLRPTREYSVPAALCGSSICPRHQRGRRGIEDLAAMTEETCARRLGDWRWQVRTRRLRQRLYANVSRVFSAPFQPVSNRAHCNSTA
ncbi:hypothetical protein DAI22_01g157950 [Oryza sativa Japonica Group]|nr:hypothetical protein DAI22_01g157950 [Oryza sativa Japonica Group]